ncbi:hypothetical protein GGR56DRAFT_17591 [Xylariaceae sp. FL0804]|nr:hypothetical protein GGR56DRAFT_17591 [Xylariaceae sp. FL0804]
MTMENLSIHDHPPPPAQAGGAPPLRGPAPAAPPQTTPQLPPQMFTTAAQLLDLTDKKLLVCLRDGRKLTGILRSWDQFANLVLQSTVERVFATTSDARDAATQPPRGLYADREHGIFLVRGENVLLLGEIDLDRDDEPPAGYERSDDWAAVERAARERRDADRARDRARLRKLATHGFEGEAVGDILL